MDFLNLLGNFQNRGRALFGLQSGVRGNAVRFKAEHARAFATGFDFSARGRLADQTKFRAVRFALDNFTPRVTTDFFVAA